MRKASKLVAEICLYGNGRPGCGVGYLAHVGPLTRDTVLLGDGEPHDGWGFTDAIFRACDDLTRAGCPAGLVRIFDAGGQRMADTDLHHPGYYGDMKWQAATVYVVSAEAIEAAAEKGGAS